MPRALVAVCILLTAWGAVLPVAQARQAADTTWVTYTARPGDTLFAISQRHDVALDSLRAWNGVTASDLKAGMTLRVGYERAQALDSTRVTLLDVVASYGLEDSLRVWQPGSSLWLGETSVQRTTAARPPRMHVVTAGETLFGLSRTYGVDPDRLRQVNSMSDTGLRIGQELRIPGSDGSVTASGLDVLPPVHEIVSTLAWPPSFEGQPLRSGERYDPSNWQAGHPEWPVGTVILLENPENGRMALARVADRTPGRELGVLDVSRSVFEALGLQLSESEAPTLRVRARILPWSVVP